MQEANAHKWGWHEFDDIFYLARLQLDSADRTSDKKGQGQGFNFCALNLFLSHLKTLSETVTL